MSCINREGPAIDSPATGPAGAGFNAPDRMQPRAPARVPEALKNGRAVKEAGHAPEGLYRPDYRVMTPAMRSPEYVQMSTAAAITLGLVEGRMYNCSCTRCLNLLLTYPEGCRANCAYCGLARHREAERNYADRNFIRVDWPAAPMAEVVDRIAADIDATPFHRMCISMITHPNSDEDTVTVLKTWTDRIDPDAIPISILSNPTTMTREDIVRLKEMGSDIFTVALDAASPAIFDRTRGKGVQSPHSWATYWEAIHMARDIFGPQKFGAHLIVGMGETEAEMMEVIQTLVDMGGHSHMFCFYPETGSLMDHLPATPRDQWRRVQLARYLVDYCGVRVDQMRFDEEGRIADFGLPASELAVIVDSGIAFRTSGCPGKVAEDISACDRPYGDSPPSDIASYPFAPRPADLRKVRHQLGMERPDDPYVPGEELDLG
jgi:biotin synthase-related radical SAM superfamily protein